MRVAARTRHLHHRIGSTHVHLLLALGFGQLMGQKVHQELSEGDVPILTGNRLVIPIAAFDEKAGLTPL